MQKRRGGGKKRVARKAAQAQPQQPQLNGLQKKNLLKLFLQELWPQRRAKFVEMWEAMPLDERKALVREVYPSAPNTPEDHSLTMDGVTVDVKEGCILLPHLTVSELSAGNNLINLFDERGSPERDEMEIVKKDYAFIKDLIKSGKHKGNLETIEHIIVFISTVDNFGHAVELPPPPTPDDVKMWFETEMVINESVFCPLFEYQEMTVNVLIRMLEVVHQKKLLTKRNVNASNNASSSDKPVDVNK